MTVHPMPTVHRLDVISANGIPLRFMVWVDSGTVRYYDRRYTLQPGQPGYGINHTWEDGQACGPAMTPDSFDPWHVTGIRGWNSIDVWDVDPATMRVVTSWVQHTITAYTAHLESLR